MESIAAKLILNALQGQDTFYIQLDTNNIKPAIAMEYLFQEHLTVSLQNLTLSAKNFHEITDLVTAFLPQDTKSAMDLLLSPQNKTTNCTTPINTDALTFPKEIFSI